MTLFDFFECNQSQLLHSFSKYFDLDEQMVFRFFHTVNRETIDVETVMDGLSIKLNNYNSEKAIYLCRHMTTSSQENLNSFIETGILNLKQMLCSENALSIFLKNKGVMIDYNARTIHIDEKRYRLDFLSGECLTCIKGNPTVCKSRFDCTFKEKLKALSLKLYKYDATTEFFISGDIEAMKRYSTICWYPEILHTIEEICLAMRNNNRLKYKLCNEWTLQNPICLVIEFKTKLSDMETFNPMSKDAWYREYQDCLIKSGYSYSDFYAGNIPKQVFDNFKLISDFNSLYCWGACGDKYGSLMPDSYVLPSQITNITTV